MNIMFLCLGFFLATAVLIFASLLFLVLFFTVNNDSNLFLYCILLLLVAVLTDKIYQVINKKFNNYKYHLIV